MDLDLDLTKKVVGTVTEDTPPASVTQGIPVYIPLLMGNIGKGAPKTYQAKTNGRAIFKNAQECMPTSSSTLKQRNFILAKKEDNISLTRILKKSNGVYVIPKNTKLQVSFTHGKLSSTTFNTDTFIS